MSYSLMIWIHGGSNVPSTYKMFSVFSEQFGIVRKFTNFQQEGIPDTKEVCCLNQVLSTFWTTRSPLPVNEGSNDQCLKKQECSIPEDKLNQGQC